MVMHTALIGFHFACSMVEEAPKDHRGAKLDSVCVRYSSTAFHKVSYIPAVTRDCLLSALGTESGRDEWSKNSANLRLRSQPYLIMSPSRTRDHRWVYTRYEDMGCFLSHVTNTLR